MSAEAQLVTDLWDAVRDVIPASKREEAAIGLLRALEEYGFERADIAGIEEDDDDLASAFETVFDADDDDEEANDE